MVPVVGLRLASLACISSACQKRCAEACFFGASLIEPSVLVLLHVPELNPRYAKTGVPRETPVLVKEEGLSGCAVFAALSQTTETERS